MALTVHEINYLEEIKKGNISNAERLVIEEKVNPHVQDIETGSSGYHMALFLELPLFVKTFNWLLEQGVDINTRDSYGRTPIMLYLNVIHIFNFSKRKKIEYMLNKQADPTIPDNGGDTALHRVVDNGAVSLLRLFLDNISIDDWNCVDDDGLTPFAYAMWEKKIYMYKIFTDYGVDPNYTEAEGIPSAKDLYKKLPLMVRRLC